MIEGKIVDVKPTCMCGDRGAACRHLGRCEVEPQPVPPRFQMDECFEVGIGHGPLRGWEVRFVVVDCHGAVKGLGNGFANLTIYEEHLLVNLRNVSFLSRLTMDKIKITHDPSEIDKTRGASSEEGFTDMRDPLVEVVVKVPFVL